MPDTHNTKNFMAHGGNELVIGGKLTFLEGAVVEGLSLDGILEKAANIADREATTVATLRTEFNALLAALKEAGFMEADAEPDPEEDGDGEDGDNDPGNEPENGGSGGEENGGGEET